MARLRLRRDRDVALRVEAQRPVVQVGRADPQQAIVDDRHLGVDDDPLAGPCVGAEGEEPVVPIGGFQPEQNLGPGGVHRHAVEPTGAASRGHQHHLGPVGLVQPLGQRIGHDRRGEILVLHIDQPLGFLDRLDVQPLVLAHFVAAAEARFGAGDGDGHVGEIGRQPLGPGVGVDGIRHRPFPRRLEPAFARQIAQRQGGRPVHHAHGLVPGRRDDPGRLAATRVVVAMRRRIPAIHRDVAAAAEGHPVVDDHRLLVMTRADRPGRIEAKLDHPLAEPALRPMGIEALGRRDQQRRLPDQQAHVQLGAGLDHHPQQVADLGLLVAGAGFRIQSGSRIKLPAQHDDRSPRLAERGNQGVEVGLVLHQHRQPVRRLHAPAGVAGNQQGPGVENGAIGDVLHRVVFLRRLGERHRRSHEAPGAAIRSTPRRQGSMAVEGWIVGFGEIGHKGAVNREDGRAGAD